MQLGALGRATQTQRSFNHTEVTLISSRIFNKEHHSQRRYMQTREMLGQVKHRRLTATSMQYVSWLEESGGLPI